MVVTRIVEGARTQCRAFSFLKLSFFYGVEHCIAIFSAFDQFVPGLHAKMRNVDQCCWICGMHKQTIAALQFLEALACFQYGQRT